MLFSLDSDELSTFVSVAGNTSTLLVITNLGSSTSCGFTISLDASEELGIFKSSDKSESTETLEGDPEGKRCFTGEEDLNKSFLLLFILLSLIGRDTPIGPSSNESLSSFAYGSASDSLDIFGCTSEFTTGCADGSSFLFPTKININAAMATINIIPTIAKI